MHKNLLQKSLIYCLLTSLGTSVRVSCSWERVSTDWRQHLSVNHFVPAPFFMHRMHQWNQTDDKNELLKKPPRRENKLKWWEKHKGGGAYEVCCSQPPGGHLSCQLYLYTVCFHFLFLFFFIQDSWYLNDHHYFLFLSSFYYWPLTVHPSLSENCEKFCLASRGRWFFLCPVLPPAPPPPSVFFPEPERCGKKRLTSCWQRAESGAEAKKTVQTDLSMPLVISFNIIKSFYSFRSSRGPAAPRWRTLSRRFQPRLVLALPTRLPDGPNGLSYFVPSEWCVAADDEAFSDFKASCSQVGLMDVSQNT